MRPASATRPPQPPRSRQAPLLQVEAVPACPVCSGAGALLHEGVPDGFGITGNAWAFRRCTRRGCRHVWLDPVPTHGDLPRAYDDYPVHHAAATHAPAKPSLPGRAYHGLLRGLGVTRRRAELESYGLPPGQGKRLLEVGCGNGHRLLRLQGRGYHVEGQDVAPAAVAVAERSGIRVHHGELRQLALPAASFDVLVMNHVLEHVRHPATFLAECRRLLAPGGRLVSVQPNGASLAHRTFGPAWVGLDPPRHLHAFTPASVRRAARDAGFAKVDVKTTALRAEHWVKESMARQRAAQGLPAADPPYGRMVSTQLAALATGAGLWGAGDEIVLTAS